jgi:capsular polysaccharide biosynthesis protein
MDRKKRVAVESGFGLASLKDDAGYRQFKRPPAVRLDGNWTSIVSRWSAGFYHWFMDALPRLALFEEWPPDIRVIVPPDLHSYQIDTLRWLGLEDRYRPTREEHLVIEHYYFSSPTMMTGLLDPYGVTFLRNAFAERGDSEYDSPKRFYVQRVGAARGIVNDAEVVQFFQARGWAVVDTQQLTMAQQIQLFAKAEEICALHGAALTNLLWCRPGTKVLELVADTFMNGVYEGIAESVGLNYNFVMCRSDAQFRAHVDIARLRERLG